MQALTQGGPKRLTVWIEDDNGCAEKAYTVHLKNLEMKDLGNGMWEMEFRGLAQEVK